MNNDCNEDQQLGARPKHRVERWTGSNGGLERFSFSLLMQNSSMMIMILIKGKIMQEIPIAMVSVLPFYVVHSIRDPTPGIKLLPNGNP